MQIELVQDGKVLRTHSHEGRLYAEAPKSGSYTIRLRNDGPSRRLAVLSVDGINVLDGEDGRVEGPGYVLGPWATLEVPGFRRDSGKVAAFEFAPDKVSYAEKSGRGTSNVGVIGVAVFDEKVVTRPIVIEKHVHHHHNQWPWGHWPYEPKPWNDPYRPTWTSHTDIVCNDGHTATVNNVMRDSGATLSANAGVVLNSSTMKSIVDVGTAYGKEMDFATTSTSFVRATTQPATILELRYATRERLKKMGVDLTAPVLTISSPNPFPGSTGMSVPAPPGWRG